MDDKVIRLECLRIAASLVSDQSEVIPLAEKLYAFFRDEPPEPHAK